MKLLSRPLTIVAYSSAGLGIMMCLVALGTAVMLLYWEAYPDVFRFAFTVFVLIGVAIVRLDLGVVILTVRGWSWRNVMIVGLTLANVAFTGVLFVLFRYFSQPLAGTGAP